ncbi:MAG: ankyrin repeat domain-containing protein [Acidobacteria bacterium]|nr:ankyrin repeat domain-containing protein [Acidobacteriota bacterium]
MRQTMNDDYYEKKHEKERLHYAASLGGIEEIRALLDEQLPINAFDDLGHTPRHCAAIGGHIEAVRYLIKMVLTSMLMTRRRLARLRSGQLRRTVPSLRLRCWLTQVPIRLSKASCAIRLSTEVLRGRKARARECISSWSIQSSDAPVRLAAKPCH